MAEIAARNYNNNPYVHAEQQRAANGIEQGGAAFSKAFGASQQANLNAAAQDKALKDAKALANDKSIKPGTSLRAGDISVNNSGELKQQMAAQKESMKALSSAQQTYNKGLPKLQDQAQALGELHDVLQDPNQMSLGTARTLLLKGFGMNRYNEKEAEAVVPKTLQGTFAKISNSTGGDANPLTPAQVQDIAKMAGHMTSNLKNRHDTLKQSAIDNYNINPNADPALGQTLQNSLGKSFEDQVGHISDKLSSIKPGPMQDPNAPRQGLVQKIPEAAKGLKELLFGSPGRSPAVASSQGAPVAPGPQAPPQPPAAPQNAALQGLIGKPAAPQAFDPDSYLGK